MTGIQLERKSKRRGTWRFVGCNISPTRRAQAPVGLYRGLDEIAIFLRSLRPSNDSMSSRCHAEKSVPERLFPGGQLLDLR